MTLPRLSTAPSRTRSVLECGTAVPPFYSAQEQKIGLKLFTPLSSSFTLRVRCLFPEWPVWKDDGTNVPPCRSDRLRRVDRARASASFPGRSPHPAFARD